MTSPALFWKSHCATCSPVYLILYHVTWSCKGPIGWHCFIHCLSVFLWSKMLWSNYFSSFYSCLQWVSQNSWQTVSEVCLKLPKFATNLAISLHNCQLNWWTLKWSCDFRIEFVVKLWSSSQAKFASIGVAGLVI